MSLSGLTNALPLETVEGLLPRGLPSCAAACSYSLPSATELCSMVAAHPPQLGLYGDCLSNACSSDAIDALVADTLASCVDLVRKNMANSASSCADVPSSITVVRSSPTTESPPVLPPVSSTAGLFQNATASSAGPPMTSGNATLSATAASASATLSSASSTSLPAATHETTAAQSGTASKTESPSSVPTTGAAALALPSLRHLAVGLAVGAISVLFL